MGNMKHNWSFWFHSSRNASWAKDSYDFLTKTNNANDFWGVFKYLKESHYNSGIFFVMKEDIFPDWSSPENRDGGFISIKIDTYDLHHITKIWIVNMISENIIEDKNEDFVHGLSISPKNGHYILKLWCNQKTKSTKLIKNLPHISTSKFTSFSYKK